MADPPLLNLELPWPPSVNHYWGTRRGGGGRYLTARAKAYRETVRLAVLELPSKVRHYLPYPGPMSLEISCWPPDRRERDIDNIDKGLLDALAAAGIVRKDSQFKQRLTVMHDYDEQYKGTGRVLVTVETW